MEKIKEFAEKHPWATAGIVFVLGLIIIFWWSSGSSSSSGTTIDNSGAYNAAAQAALGNDALQAAQLNNAAQLQGLELQNQQAAAQTAAYTSVGLAQANAPVLEAQIAADVQKTSLADTLTATLNTNADTLAATKNTNAANVTVAGSNNAMNLAIAKSNNKTALAEVVSNNQSAVTINAANDTLASLVSNNNLTGLLNTNELSALQSNNALAGLVNTNASTLAATNSNNAAAVEENANTNNQLVSVAGINAGAATTESNNALTLGLAQTAAGVTVAGINAGAATTESNNAYNLGLAQSKIAGVTSVALGEQQADIADNANYLNADLQMASLGPNAEYGFGYVPSPQSSSVGGLSAEAEGVINNI